jgi:hypothetical protein
MDADFNEIMHLNEIAGCRKIPTIFRRDLNLRSQVTNRNLKNTGNPRGFQNLTEQKGFCSFGDTSGKISRNKGCCSDFVVGVVVSEPRTTKRTTN